MRLTWTFYTKDKQCITLTVIYVPELDQQQLSSGGYLDVAANCAYVNWETYGQFNDASVETRRDAFARLTRMSQSNEVIE